jgi:hypothetical protein
LEEEFLFDISFHFSSEEFEGINLWSQMGEEEVAPETAY